MNADRDNTNLNRTDTTTTSTHTGNARVYDAAGSTDGTRRSNYLPYLIGGLVIALGLLGFLFYDGGSVGDVNTTSSTTTTQGAPATGTGTTTAPATPTTPPRPAQ